MLLAGCGNSSTPEEQALKDARDVAMVEAANKAEPPLELVTPEPILLPDLERYDLYGDACNYAPGTSLGTRVVAREADAFVKIDGEVQRFAADPGSRELPLGTRTLYNGKEFSLQLEIRGEGEATPDGKTNYEGTVTLRDPHGRPVYEGTGLAQCGG
ncbi:hypothetical protein KK137_05450 [Croceibacterium sp. LX-88]|jgi:hypothetical protein|uniref:Lipoprotein n=1 Tax=Croceibacterium selenioxidans TaxID=2838833 RepID=A0ABS5W281_9SPHN|nr:hypothetical protein [Croceibacterium selenioxidans]MBT2133774.1 hypothetical protein [Croceibacterium selenioxidans]